jgi:hypothetical protein
VLISYVLHGHSIRTQDAYILYDSKSISCMLHIHNIMVRDAYIMCDSDTVAVIEISTHTAVSVMYVFHL